MNGENALIDGRRRAFEASPAGLVGEALALQRARIDRPDEIHPVVASIERIITQLASQSGERTRRLVRLVVAFVLLLATGIVGFGGNPASAATPPVFPDNLVVFPNRDFISAEGFESHIGENALVQVFRDGGIIGGAEVTMSPGGVPFEINHPGGFCWGNDIPGFRDGEPATTIPAITPEILPGDQILLTFENPDPLYGATTDIETLDAYVAPLSPEVPAVSDVTTVLFGGLQYSRFTVTGHIGDAVNRANLEQRIVNPDLTGTTVAKRDVRAVPPTVAGVFEPNNTGAYLSILEFDLDGPNTFRATYLFAEADVARIAATGGGERLLSWQLTDPAANRQGITIAEFGEVGGPGMGGCPLGPNQSGPPAPSSVDTRVSTSNGSRSIAVTWTEAVSIPGAPPITGYRVHAVETGTATGRAEIGRRISDPAATGTTITGLDGNVNYDVQVVSVSDVGETFPAVHDTVAPDLVADPIPGVFPDTLKVTLSSNDPGAQIWYTIDGTDTVDSAGDLNTGITGITGPQLYTGPIPIGETTTVKAVAFDSSGNAAAQSSFVYIINAVPMAPTDLSASAGQNSVTINWTEADPTVTGYGVHLYDTAVPPNLVAALLQTGRAAGAQQTLTISGLIEETSYAVTVMAERDPGTGTGIVYGPESTPLEFTTQGVPPVVVANAGSDKTVVRGDTVYLDGSLSSGDTLSFAWTTPDPAVVLTGADTATPSFVFPVNLPGPVTLDLTVTDGALISASASVTISAEAVVGNAGPDQTVLRGSNVTLDGTGSTPANPNLSFSWATSDPVEILTGADTATPSFVFPVLQASPVTLILTVFDASGASATDTVIIAPLNSDPLTLTRAEYRSTKNKLRIDGATTVPGPGNEITLWLNNKNGTTALITAPVDNLGVWAVRFSPPGNLTPEAGDTLTITSSQGGLIVGQPIAIRR